MIHISLPLLTVNVHVVITPTGTPTAGDTFSLDCSVTRMDDSAIYQWFDSNGTQLVNISQLQFSPLRASEGGAYTCRATVRGVVAEGTATITVICKYLQSLTIHLHKLCMHTVRSECAYSTFP